MSLAVKSPPPFFPGPNRRAIHLHPLDLSARRSLPTPPTPRSVSESPSQNQQSTCKTCFTNQDWRCTSQHARHTYHVVCLIFTFPRSRILDFLSATTTLTISPPITFPPLRQHASFFRILVAMSPVPRLNLRLPGSGSIPVHNTRDSLLAQSMSKC